MVGPRITEGDHEREEIGAERDDPQERHHRRPLRDGIGGRDQQSRSECRVEHPQQQRIAVARAKRTRIGHLGVWRAADREHAAGSKQSRIQHVGPGPPAGLLHARQQPLEEEWIGEQAQERPDIGGGEETHRIEIGRDMRKPARKQGRRRCQRDIGQADAHRQQSQNAPRGIARIYRLPIIGGRDRQQQQGQNKDADLQLGLPVDGQRQRDRIGVRIAHQQRHLEEQHAYEPGRRAASEPWQDELAKDELHLKQQEACQRHGGGEYERGGVLGSHDLTRHFVVVWREKSRSEQRFVLSSPPRRKAECPSAVIEAPNPFAERA